MKKKAGKSIETIDRDTMRPEYDFSGAVRLQRDTPREQTSLSSPRTCWMCSPMVNR